MKITLNRSVKGHIYWNIEVDVGRENDNGATEIAWAAKADALLLDLYPDAAAAYEDDGPSF